MTTHFADLPIDQRFRFLDAIRATGGDWTSYEGAYVGVQVPRIDWTPANTTESLAATAIRQAQDGLRLCDSIAALCGMTRDQEPYYFPLGTLRVPAIADHDGPAYCGYGRGGYRFIAHYRPAAS